MDFDIANVRVIHNEEEKQFEVDLVKKKAFLEYAIKKDRIIFLHTEVPGEFSGQGIAGKMAREALEFAKEKGYSVSTICSYIAAYLQRHPEYQDLVRGHQQ